MNDRQLMQQAKAALSAMLTHMGMDEDEWNKPTFDQCRKAEAALRERLAQPCGYPYCGCNSKAWCKLERMAENARELGLDYEPPCKTGSQCTSKCQQCEQPAKEQKLEFVSPGGGYVPAIPRPIPLDWKLVPRKATPEMLRAMDECAQEGYDERLYEGMASSVYMAAWDASPVMGTLPEQPAQQQEPVVWMYINRSTHETSFQKQMRSFVDHSQWKEVPLYSEPLANHEFQCVCGAVWCGDEMVHLPDKRPQPSKPWVGLTEQEVDECYYWKGRQWTTDELVRHVEAKLREKNA